MTRSARVRTNNNARKVAALFDPRIIASHQMNTGFAFDTEHARRFVVNCVQVPREVNWPLVAEIFNRAIPRVMRGLDTGINLA